MKIEMSRTYKTRSGVAVRILAVDLDNGEYTVAGFIKGDGVYTYTAEGKFTIFCSPRPEDLVEVPEWADFQVDDKVMVRASVYTPWCLHYFAGVNKEGKPMTLSNSSATPTIWNECRRPTEEELK